MLFVAVAAAAAVAAVAAAAVAAVAAAVVAAVAAVAAAAAGVAAVVVAAVVAVVVAVAVQRQQHRIRWKFSESRYRCCYRSPRLSICHCPRLYTWALLLSGSILRRRCHHCRCCNDATVAVVGTFCC